jgi:hypothetical protein
VYGCRARNFVDTARLGLPFKNAQRQGAEYNVRLGLAGGKAQKNNGGPGRIRTDDNTVMSGAF